MMKFIEPLLELPVLPASFLLAMLMIWSVLAILGGADLHGHDVGIDHDLDIGHDVDVGHDGDLSDAVSGLGMVTLRWLNLSDMPVMIWLCIFSILWWTVSITLWKSVDTIFLTHPGIGWSSLLIVRNLAIALPLTKLATRPLRGWHVSEDLSSKSLIGQECEICSIEATPQYGQVRFKTDGAPLLLNVRTDGPHLAKGTKVWIAHFDAKTRTYIVSPTTSGE